MAEQERTRRNARLRSGPGAAQHTAGTVGPFLLTAALLLVAALAYTVQEILSPFILLLGLVYLLYPWREDPVPGRLLRLAMGLFVLWFAVTLLGILAPFLIAFLLAYLLNPLVVRLESRRIPRWLASLVAILLLAALGIAAGLFILPAAFRQFEGILAGLRSIVTEFMAFVNSGAVGAFAEQYGIDGQRAQEFVTGQVTPKLEQLLLTLFEGLFGVVSGLSGVVLQIINIIIIPFIVFYLLKDYPAVIARFRSLVPRRRREGLERIVGRVDEILSSYVRGAVIVAGIQGLIAFVGLWFLGVDYSLVLGIMTGVLNFIPYVGLLTSLVVASIVAVFSGGPVLVKVGGVVALYLAQKLLEATVLGPRIVGTQVGLHPVLLILCLLVFGYFLGFVGLLIAVPATAVMMTFVREWEIAQEGEG
jgi:predicted PurR-regulated permease PerM